MTKALFALLAASAASAQTVNPVVQWNRNLLVILRTAGAQPATIHSTRSFALMHLAMYEAVNNIDRTRQPYRIEIQGASTTASQDAAAASAAHEILTWLYPSFQSSLDTQFQQSLSAIPAGSDRDAGVALGALVADRIAASRIDDGSNTVPPPFQFGSGQGVYQSTPPNFPQPQLTAWSAVTPFALPHASQFRPSPPPALTSKTYTDALSEIQSLGVANSTAATDDQKVIGRFWNAAIQNYWNEITQTNAVANNLTTAQSARLFALLNLSLADTVVAFYDAKYTYQLWRPVTAIRATAVPDWLPEVTNTAADPSYPGAHAAISAAAATVLSWFFGGDQMSFNVTSEVLPGVVRSFPSFSAAFQEASLSRIYAGQHFRFDEDAGQQLGMSVAQYVTSNFLQ
jgi:hypothetical protein